MNVTVIGAAGRMGRWLVHHFLSQGHDLTISDLRAKEAKEFARSAGVRFTKENSEAVEDADLTILSTPLVVTPCVLKEVVPNVKKDSIVAKISSLKSQIFPILSDMASLGIRPLSIHPLFGPGARRLGEEKIALIPVVDASSEVGLVTGFFPGAEVIVVNAEEHDRAMALTLSLPHFLNIIFASAISGEDFNVLKKLGGTTFTLQLTLSEGVMIEDPGLYASIQMNNEYTLRYLDKFLSRGETVRGWISGKDQKRFTEFYSSVQSSISKDKDFSKSYERMYKVLELF